MSGPHSRPIRSESLCAARLSTGLKGVRELRHYGSRVTSKFPPDSFPDTQRDRSVVLMFLAGNGGDGSQTCVVMADPDFP